MFPTLSLNVRAALLSVACALSLGTQARAAEVSEEQARATEAQIKTWIAGLLANRVPIPADLLSVKPAGETYVVSLKAAHPLVSLMDAAGQPTDAGLSAVLRRGEGTRWAIESLKLPTTTRFGAMPPKPAAGAPAGNPPPMMAISIRDQNTSGVFDTAPTGESRLEYRLDGVKYETRGLGTWTESLTTVDRYAGRWLARGTPSGAIDLGSESTVDGYMSVNSHPVFGMVTMSMRHANGRGVAAAVMTNQIGGLIRTLVALGYDTQAARQPGAAPIDSQATSRIAIRTMIAALKGVMTGVEMDQTMDDFDVQALDGRAAMTRMRVAMGGAAPNDRLKAFLEVSAEGLNIFGLPPRYNDLIPRSFAIRPVLSNIDVRAFTALADDAAAEGADPAAMKARLETLLSTTGVRMGFERLDLDMGFASLAGSGEATVIGPNAARGHADIAITGLDALMQRVQTMPDAGQGMAVLTMAKGLGKARGDKTVWHIEFTAPQQVLVNGIDLSKMGQK